MFLVYVFFFSSRTSLKGTLILTPLLGTTWTCGFFAFGDATVVFSYLFVIFNCLQGVFMCAIYCVFNNEVGKKKQKLYCFFQSCPKVLTTVFVEFNIMIIVFIFQCSICIRMVVTYKFEGLLMNGLWFKHATLNRTQIVHKCEQKVSNTSNRHSLFDYI